MNSHIEERQIIAQDGTLTKYKEIYNVETGAYLSTVGLAYKAIPHERINDMVANSLHTLSIDFQQELKILKGGRDSFQKFTLEGFNEQVKPQIIIKNTLMSGKALKLFAGSFTLACANGAIRGKKKAVLTHAHVTVLNEAPVHKLIVDFCNTYPEHLLKLEKMKSVQAIPVDFFLDWVLADRDKLQIEQMFKDRMSNHANDNRRGDSLRDLYETATEYYTHKVKISEAGRIERLSVIDDITDRLLVGVN